MSSDHVSFSVARKRLQEFFEKFVPTVRKECINPYCVLDTEGAVLYIWKAYSPKYVHTKRQKALNKTTMRVWGEKFLFRSPYCCECFKKHVLVGDNKNVSQQYGYYRPGVQHVVVFFHWEPTPSSWYNSAKKRDEDLTEFQKSMFCRPVDYTDNVIYLPAIRHFVTCCVVLCSCGSELICERVVLLDSRVPSYFRNN